MIRVSLVTCLSYLVFSNLSFSQGVIDSDLKDIAVTRVASYLDIRSTLPSKWATYVRYEIASTPDAKYQRESKGTELFAESMGQKSKFAELKVNDTHYKNGQDETSGAHILVSFSGERRLIFDGNDWKSLRAFPLRDIFDPLSLPVCSGAFDFGCHEQGVFMAFFGPNRECLRVYERDGDLFSIWGQDERRDRESHSVVVRFDKKSEKPSEVMLMRYATWDPGKLDQPHRLVAKTMTEWTLIESEGLYVPTKIEAIDCLEDDKNKTLEFRLEWKFGDDVPDGLFDDPRKGNLPKPQFKERGMAKF